MTINDSYKKSLKYFLKFAFLLLFSVGVQAQSTNTTNGTQVSDGSVLSTVHNPLTFSILDLSSVERGFLLPRMSTEERSAISMADIKPGLMVYNTTIDCIEFYSASRQLWLSLCGDEKAPAELEISDANCNNITISGNYAEGVFLNPRANIVNLQVSVSVPGTYQIEAEAYNGNTKNGYSFTGNGSFPTAGIYNVTLRGSGTPIKGYLRNTSGEQIEKGDNIRFVLNGKESSCIAYNFVESKALKYDFTINQNLVNKVYKGVSIEGRNDILEAVVTNITMPGRIEISSVSDNGMLFSGSYVLTPTDVKNRTTTIKLVAKGTAYIPMVTPMQFRSNSFVDYSQGEREVVVNKDVKVENVKLEFICNNNTYPFQVKGDWEVNKPFTQYHNLLVAIRVLAPGKAKVVARTSNQGTTIVFASDIEDFSFDTGTTGQVRYVKLNYKSGIPLKSGITNLDIQLESQGPAEYGDTYPDYNIVETSLCTYPVNIKGEAKFDFSKNTKLSFEGDLKYSSVSFFTPRTDIDNKGNRNNFRLLLTTNVLEVGEYDFATQEINGITFTAKGSISNVGTQTITLYPKGKSGSDMPTQSYNISNFGLNTGLSVNVDFVYRQMTMYSLGGAGESWHPGGNNSWDFSGGPRLVRTLNNFGWNGVVRIAKLDIIGINDPQSGSYVNTLPDFTSSNVNTFKSRLAQADMVFVGGNNSVNITGKGREQLRLLADYVKNKKGVLMYGEGVQDDMKFFMNELGYSISTTAVTSVEHNNANIFLASSSNAASLILGNDSSYFGQKYNSGSLVGRLVGAHSTGTSFFIQNLPSDFVSLAVSNKSNNASIKNFAYVHKTLGFVGVNNSTFMGGYSSNATSNNSYPTNSTAVGVPRTGSYTDGAVYNAWFLLNLVHWAIDYAQENKVE